MNWSKSVKIALGAKNKYTFLEAKHSKPKEARDEQQKWVRCDYMVRSWLLETMKQKIDANLVSIQSIKELRSEIVGKYGQTNAPQLFHLKKLLCKL